jgi:hypothetical protein
VGKDNCRSRGRIVVADQIAGRSSTAGGSATEVTPFPDLHVESPFLTGTTGWSLSVKYQNKEYPLHSPSEVALQVLDFQPKQDGTAGDRFIATHRTALSKFFTSLNSLGKEEVYFLHSQWLPIKVASKDDAPCMVFTNFASTNLYNSLRLTEKQRAAKVLDTLVLPILQKLDDSLYDSEIPHYCIVYFYGSQDFSQKSRLSIRPEVLVLVISREICHAFAKGKLSQEKLLSRTEVFIGSEDVKPRRVDITID